MPRQNSFRRPDGRLIATLCVLLLSHAIHVHAFFVSPPLPVVKRTCIGGPFLNSKSRAFTTTVAPRYTTKVEQGQQEQQQADGSGDNPDADDDEQKLLETVNKAQLQDLCSQLDLKQTGTKLILLKRLRQHAADQAESELQRTKAGTVLVEEGSDDQKQRYEIWDGNSLVVVNP
jgi:hypothetical protein